MHLAGEHGESFQPVNLGAFDLRIPIGTFHQADHQPAPGAAREVDKKIQNEGRTLLVSLHHKTNAVPPFKSWVEAQPIEQIEREIQTVGFLGVDVHADLVRTCQASEPSHARQQLGHDAITLGPRITRMQRGKLDGNTRAFINSATLRRCADCIDRLFVVAQVAGGVGGGHGRLAQHIVGIAEALCLPFTAAGQRLLDVPAEHELLAQEAHGKVDRRAHNRLAARPISRVSAEER